MRLSRALSGLVILATLVAGVLTVMAAAQPISDLGALVYAMYGWGAIGLAWLASLLVAIGARDIRPALIAPAFVIAIALLTFSGVPRRALVALNDRALTDFVVAADQGHIQSPPDWNHDWPIVVGDVPVYWFERQGGATHLVSGFTGSDTPAGLVRLPGGELPRTAFRYEHLHGDWYRWFPAGW